MRKDLETKEFLTRKLKAKCHQLSSLDKYDVRKKCTNHQPGEYT